MPILIQEYALELPLSLSRTVISPTVMTHNVINISRALAACFVRFLEIWDFSGFPGFWARIWYTLELQNHHLGSWPHMSKSLIGYIWYTLYVRAKYCNVRYFQMHFGRFFGFDFLLWILKHLTTFRRRPGEEMCNGSNVGCYRCRIWYIDNMFSWKYRS